MSRRTYEGAQVGFKRVEGAVGCPNESPADQMHPSNVERAPADSTRYQTSHRRPQRTRRIPDGPE